MITRATEYACLAMLYLAKQPTGTSSYTAEIARVEHIPPSFLAKVINQLSRAGLVISRRGPTGGLELARDPRDISLRDIVEAIEGEVAVNVCTAAQDYTCFRSGCALKAAFHSAQDAFLAALSDQTLASLVRDDGFVADRPDPRPQEVLT